jgi:hypothetical protein
VDLTGTARGTSDCAQRNVLETAYVVQLVAVTDCRPEENDTMDDQTFTRTGPPSLPGPDPRQRRRYLLPAAAALLGLALAAAACSSSPSTPGVAGSGTGATTTTVASAANQGMPTLTPAQRADQLAYSRCMRAHGVSDFPDPDSQGRILIQGGPGSDLNSDNPTFKNAQNACQSKQPKPTAAQQAQAEAYALRVSRCMRAHGIKDYPDPSSGSGGRIGIRLNNSPGSDLNPNNPLFQRAQAKCMPNAPKLPGGNHTSSGSGSGGDQTSTNGVG